MRIRKPIIVGPRMLLSLFLSWAGAVAVAFSLGLRIG
jgi:hypothetical protein